ncbi:MAG TPA: M20/M25/M40 family metallo-hydrolase [Longimicrobium sp.]
MQRRSGEIFAHERETMEDRELARELFRELIETDTSPARGTTAAAEAVAARLVAAGFPAEDVRVLGPHPAKHNLVARLRGTGARPPILLLAHLDVVDARPEDWTVPPFRLTEEDGFFYGRGTLDDKAMCALWIAALIRLRREGFAPDRDLIVALTADEEGGEHNGAAWLVEHHRELVDAAFGLNEGGYGRMEGGRRASNQIQASEKIPFPLRLEAEGRGGHSSLPAADNAIGRMAAGLARLAAHPFPLGITEAVQGFFARMAEAGGSEDMRLAAELDMEAAARLAAASPYHAALMRTTCVPTRLEAGEADNAHPLSARATLDCRILPGESPDEVLRTIVAVLDDPTVTVTPLAEPRAAPPSPLTPEIVGAVERVTEGLWPGVPVVPVMTIGATDSRHFRAAGIPMYGVSGIFLDVADARAHAPDERLGVEAFYEGGEFIYRLLKELSGPTPRSGWNSRSG